MLAVAGTWHLPLDSSTVFRMCDGGGRRQRSNLSGYARVPLVLDGTVVAVTAAGPAMALTWCRAIRAVVPSFAPREALWATHHLILDVQNVKWIGFDPTKHHNNARRRASNFASVRA